MTKIFELNKNLFKVGDNHVCVEENPCIGDIGFIKIGISGTVGVISYDEKCHTWDLTTMDNIPYPFSSKKYLNKIVFSTQFIHESIPVLDVENEESEEAELFYKDVLCNHDHLEALKKGFKSGFQKAKETFKYPEYDLRKAFQAGMDYQEGGIILYPDEHGFIQSLQQPKEIKSIEVEYELRDEFFNNDPDHCYESLSLPILLNGKIKCKINY